MFSPDNKFPVVRAYNEEDTFKPKELFDKYLYHWPLFAFFLIITLTLAVAYLKITKPIYDIHASLLINEDNIDNPTKKGNALEELNVTPANRSAENEMEVLKSRSLMKDLVTDLQLWVDYSSNEKIGKQNLYGQNPVKINFSKQASTLAGQSIIVHIKDDRTYYITEKSKVAQAYEFNNPVTISGLGTFKLEKTGKHKAYIDESIIISFHDFDKTISAYQSSITVDLLNKKSPTVGLSLKDAVPERGIAILNRMIVLYNMATIAEKNRITNSTLDFIDSRLASISRELNEVEAKSEKFRSSRGLTDISYQSRIFLERAQLNENNINQINVNLRVVEGIEDYLRSSADRSAPSTLGIDDPGLNSMIQELAKLELNKARLLATTPETNPIFDPINSQINSLKSAIRLNMGNVKRSLLDSKSQLETLEKAYRSAISDIPGEERQFLAIKRQENIKEDLFLYLLKKREEISLSYASTLADARIIDSAYLGPVKWPNKLLILAIALLAGLGLPVALLVARSLFNDKVRSQAGLEKYTDTPVLSEINEIPVYSTPLVAAEGVSPAAAEQFGYLRTRLFSLHSALTKGRVTLITSNVSEEGKAFVASNLALSLAISGKKVVLLDFDLRKNKLLDFLKIEVNKLGLSNYLQQNISKEEIINHAVVHPNLDVINSGDAFTVPSALIEKPETEQLINWLRLNYDDIIIYTPPIRLVADALIISKFSAVILFIVRSNFTKKAMLKFIDKIDKNDGFNKVNIVLNATKEKQEVKDYRKQYYPRDYTKRDLSFRARFSAFLNRF